MAGPVRVDVAWISGHTRTEPVWQVLTHADAIPDVRRGLQIAADDIARATREWDELPDDTMVWEVWDDGVLVWSLTLGRGGIR